MTWFKRHRKTPVLLQIQPSECGAAALGIVLANLGKWVDLDTLRRACGVSRDGCSAGDLVRAARNFGLHATGWRKDALAIESMALPLILFWDFNHFLVLEGLDKKYAYLNDPANGHRRVSREEFKRFYTGVCLEFKPDDSFEPSYKRPSLLTLLSPWLLRHKKSLLTPAILGLLLVIPSLALPVMLGYFVDVALVGGQAVGIVLALGTLVMGLVTYGLTWYQARSLRLIGLRVSVERAEEVLTKLFRLPMDFFAHRFAGDLVGRTQLIDGVSQNATSRLLLGLIELVMSTALLALIFYYDWVLAMVVTSLALLSGATMRRIARVRVDQNHKLRREQGLFAGIGMVALRDIDHLRATGAEDDFFARWSGYQSRELAARQRFTEYGLFAGALPTFVSLLGAAATFGIGGLRVTTGDLTIGELMTCFVLVTTFLLPVGRFVELADVIQILHADLMRIADVMNAEDDPSLNYPPANANKNGTTQQVETVRGLLKLTGRLELRNITFGYQHYREPLIREFNLSISPGQRKAIVGPTGSGKSTLASLLVGLHQPWTGELLFDGLPAEKVPRPIMTSSVGFIDQNISLFAASVKENLTMWNPTVPDHMVVDAAKDACIHDEITQRPFNYHGPVEEDGANFSAGQRQRLEIARALVSNPSLLIMDEATSALDPILEEQIMDALRRRGCACLIVAHRLSTIRDCDEIVVIDKGQAVQRGRHDELVLNKHGLYHKLIETQS